MNRNGSVGLVFAGGGGKGAYEVGVWRALEKFDLTKTITHVSGTSVGALNAALFAQGDCLLAEDVWRKIDQDIVLTPAYLKNTNMLIQILAGIDKIGLKNFTKKSANHFFSNIKNQGLFSRKGLSLIIDTYVDLKAISSSSVITYAACFNKKTLAIEYFKLNALNDEKIKSILLATSAIPVVFDSITIDNQEYFDGGLGDNIPIKPLYDAGVKTIFVVNLNASKTIDSNLFPDTTLFEITPQKSLGSFIEGTLNFNPSSLEQKMLSGYEDAMRIIKPVFKLGEIEYRRNQIMQNIAKDEQIARNKNYNDQLRIEKLQANRQNSLLDLSDIIKRGL